MFTQGPGITRPVTEFAFWSRRAFSRFILLFCLTALFVSPCLAQIPIPNAQPLPPGQDPNAGRQGSTIKVDVGLVVLHTTVLDDRGKFADGLKAENFRVFEDKVEQKLSTFKREDVPVSMGLVIDNSGSMRDKRPRVNEAAITLVEASNKQDEAFVVNFNDDFYLDLDKDFTSSIPELKEALERIDSRGSTALFDAIIGSLDHLKKASKDKRVLLVVTDGEDNSSHNSLEKTLREIQKTNTVIYTIGLLGDEKRKEKNNAMRALKHIAEASGGLAFFPESVDDVHSICEQVAHDIRNQYTLAYYPSNTNKDGTFRAVSVQVIPPHGRGKLVARTRNGYYAPGGPASSAAGN
ncbi:MAG TPA: VWA domain-containing protein [Candidatus Acidoferrum sp.]|nr:VWA domain-containing protein [Candidatus Acidoferrum sp.]